MDDDPRVTFLKQISKSNEELTIQLRVLAERFNGHNVEVQKLDSRVTKLEDKKVRLR